MTLPKPRPKVEEAKVEQPTDEKIQVITNDQMINLKLDNIQMQLNELPKLIVKEFNSQEH